MPDLNGITRIGTFVYTADPICQKCVSSKLVKCGLIRGKQRFMCKGCHSRFIPWSPRNRHNRCVELYTEGNSLRSIGRLLEISHVTAMRWIKLMAKKLHPPTPTYAKHIEIDELYFYVGSKKRKRWLWLAICRQTKRILGFCTGGRGTKTLEKLFHSISPIKCERYYTDRHAPFRNVFPKEKHRDYAISMVEASILLLAHKFSMGI